MKKFFEYVGLTVLFLFSYYYTSKIGEFMSNKDTIMVSLEEKDETLNKECIEGYINSEGVVLGISGLTIDMEKSYQNMKGLGYDESLIEYKENLCAVNKKNSLDKYIISGNPKKNSISILIEIKDYKYIDSFIAVAKEKDVEINFLIDDKLFINEDLIENYKYNFDILYSGNKIEDFLKIIPKTYCVNYKDEKILDICKKEKINTLKIKKYFQKDALLNIKTDLEKGDLIILSENKVNLSEFSSIINYITSKGMEIISITNHLE